jgi:hypothetical protein
MRWLLRWWRLSMNGWDQLWLMIHIPNMFNTLYLTRESVNVSGHLSRLDMFSFTYNATHLKGTSCHCKGWFFLSTDFVAVDTLTKIAILWTMINTHLTSYSAQRRCSYLGHCRPLEIVQWSIKPAHHALAAAAVVAAVAPDIAVA